MLALMKRFTLFFAVASVFSAGLILAETKPTTGGADALWQKVEAVMDEMKNPKKRPESREEAMAFFTKTLSDFDAAAAEFEKQSPTDARRWKAKLFGVTTLQLRDRLGLPAKGNLKEGLSEIINAADADKEIKGDASAILVLESMAEIDAGTLTSEAWTQNAETHLKNFPEGRLNEEIKKRMATNKQMAELKSKPLELKFTAVDGTEVDLAKMRGKVVLIDFWATWCGPCVAELPNVIKAYDALHAKGFEIVGISLDQDKGKLEGFVKENGMKWPQYFDGKGWQNEISTRFEIDSIPAMWLVGKDGLVISTDTRGGLEAAVEAALKK